jgi:glutaredoxin
MNSLATDGFIPPGAAMTAGNRESVPHITLYTKADCHLCGAAKATLLALQCELGFALDEIDITTNPVLYDAFREEIPVGYLDGRKLFKYRVDSTLLQRQLQRRRRWLGGRWFFPRSS